jgi:hypothetical protein
VRVVPSLSVSCNVFPDADCDRSALAKACLLSPVAVALSAIVVHSQKRWPQVGVGRPTWGQHSRIIREWGVNIRDQVLLQARAMNSRAGVMLSPFSTGHVLKDFGRKSAAAGLYWAVDEALVEEDVFGGERVLRSGHVRESFCAAASAATCALTE